MNDLYGEFGTPKYTTADSIYDALCVLAQSEEWEVLEQIGVDVSYDNQRNIYTDEGAKLKEKYESIAGWSEEHRWKIELAIYQLLIDEQEYPCATPEIHDIVYEALINTDLAKRIGFRKLFIDKMLQGVSSGYEEIVEEYAEILREEYNHFDYWAMRTAFSKLMNERGTPVTVDYYNNFCNYVHEKVMGCNLAAEKQLVIECRALLCSYDDFIYGLRANQALYESQEQRFRARMAELSAAYEKLFNELMQAAERQGIDTQGMLEGAPTLELAETASVVIEYE